MHYVKMLVGVAAGLLLYAMFLKGATEGAVSNQYAQLGIQAASVIVGLMVIGMIL